MRSTASAAGTRSDSGNSAAKLFRTSRAPAKSSAAAAFSAFSSAFFQALRALSSRRRLSAAISEAFSG
jgi:hypothetical protein